jgi:exodeoxyribonuclease V alpha subunit
MRCRFTKDIFRNQENGYCVVAYRTEDSSVPPAARNTYYTGKGTVFTAVGSHLPSTESIEVDLYGKWDRGRHGLQLLVDKFEEVMPQTLEGIRGYLGSGMIKGIGPKTAELIVGRFGTDTFDILEKEPEKLLQVRGDNGKET